MGERCGPVSRCAGYIHPFGWRAQAGWRARVRGCCPASQVHWHELAGPPRHDMHSLRHDFFSGAGWADEHNRNAGPGHLCELLKTRVQGGDEGRKPRRDGSLGRSIQIGKRPQRGRERRPKQEAARQRLAVAERPSVDVPSLPNGTSDGRNTLRLKQVGAVVICCCLLGSLPRLSFLDPPSRRGPRQGATRTLAKAPALVVRLGVR